MSTDGLRAALEELVVRWSSKAGEPTVGMLDRLVCDTYAARVTELRAVLAAHPPVSPRPVEDARRSAGMLVEFPEPAPGLCACGRPGCSDGSDKTASAAAASGDEELVEALAKAIYEHQPRSLGFDENRRHLARALLPIIAAHTEGMRAERDLHKASLEDAMREAQKAYQRATEAEAERDEARKHIAYHLADYKLNGELTGDLAVDMAAWAERMRTERDEREAELDRLQALYTDQQQVSINLSTDLTTLYQKLTDSKSRVAQLEAGIRELRNEVTVLGMRHAQGFGSITTTELANRLDALVADGSK